MNQAILWLFLLHPILENEQQMGKEYKNTPRTDVVVDICSKKQRKIKNYQKADYKVCA